MTRALMIQGTASHVGKSVLTTAFARWIAGKGWRVAPFKSQNMSLNSFVTLRGEEIARSQATQAEALGLEPTADMNPILLKPMRRGCQIVINGRSVGTMTIQEYYAYKPAAWRAIIESYDRLAAAHDVIVLEGAGSPAEINLREHDLVNMRMADYADAKVLLVADIERGGCFAHMVGTWELLSPAERNRIIGFVINKFQGDAALLDSGLRFIRERTGRPVLGVLPFDSQIQLDEEDSLGVCSSQCDNGGAEIEIAVIRLPGISNFTDFAALARLPGVSVKYVSQPEQLVRPDLIVLPGTRTTIHALDWLKRNGLAAAIERYAGRADGPIILGICGGMQLLGKMIRDPEGVESRETARPPLGLLDIETHFFHSKTLHRVEGEVIAPGSPGYGTSIVGYEVHHGRSGCGEGARPWLRLRREPGDAAVEDGAVRADGRVLGTYVHGLFDDARFARALIGELRSRRGLPPLSENEWLSQRQFWARRYERLAPWLCDHCDLGPVAAALGL